MREGSVECLLMGLRYAGVQGHGPAKAHGTRRVPPIGEGRWLTAGFQCTPGRCNSAKHGTPFRSHALELGRWRPLEHTLE